MKVHIIAELAQGYEGDIRLCRRLVDAASRSGADAVKFQIFETEELCTPDYVHFKLFKSLEIPPAQWAEIIDHAHSLKMGFYADIFGVRTLEWITKLPIDGIKVHGTDLRNWDLLKRLSSFKGEIVLSAGGGELSEIHKALDCLSHPNVVLMSGFQAEPNLIEDVELDKISQLKKEFGCRIGYADHIDAQDPLAVVLPSMAVVAGADVIEKHLTLERDYVKLEDYISALNPGEFLAMSKLVHAAAAFPRSNEYTLSAREKDYRVRTKKVPVARRDIPAGSVVNEADVDLLRTGTRPTEILDAAFFFGQTLKADCHKNSPLTRGLVE